jgi:hypothetical protein
MTSAWYEAYEGVYLSGAYNYGNNKLDTANNEVTSFINAGVWWEYTGGKFFLSNDTSDSDNQLFVMQYYYR